MKIVTLVENSTVSDNLASEHGLSFFIETDKHKILFDTGKSDLFIRNAEKLGIDLREVDTTIISHGHYDHIGGLIHFLKINHKAEIFLKKQIFDYNYYSIKENVKKNIGALPELSDYKNRFVFLDSEYIEIDEFIFISKFDKIYALPKANKYLFKEKNNIFQPDDFAHELIFLLKKNRELIVFCGCAHNGILNIISTVQRFVNNKSIKHIIGGLHFVVKSKVFEFETKSEIENIAFELQRITPEAFYHIGHCTGKQNEILLKSIFNHYIHSIYTGYEINL